MPSDDNRPEPKRNTKVFVFSMIGWMWSRQNSNHQHLLSRHDGTQDESRGPSAHDKWSGVQFEQPAAGQSSGVKYWCCKEWEGNVTEGKEIEKIWRKMGTGT